MAKRIVGAIEVSGINETIAAATAAKNEWGKAVLREVRKELRPMAADIKKRFVGLGGTGPRVASTVRTSVTGNGAAIRMGSAKHPYSLGREFGAKRQQTRPHTRHVQSGRNITRTVGGGNQRIFVAHINYASPNIFGPWTGNQFQLGEHGGRVTIEQESGHAYYPGIGAGAQHIYDALSRVAAQTIDAFPDETGKAKAAALAPTGSVSKLNAFLASGGI